VLHFKSIMSRILLLHVIAIVVTAVLMPLVLYWFMISATSKLFNRVMQEQAEAIARHLTVGADGRWSLDLAPAVRDQYSEDYGRYLYAVIDDTGKVLFASRADGSAVFPADARLPGVTFTETRHSGTVVAGATVAATVGGHSVWIQTAEDLAHRDVLIDDVVTDFFQHVAWITLPILLVLFVIDIAIFRGAIRPLLSASRLAARIAPARIDLRLPVEGMPREILPLVEAVNSALDRLEQGFRLQREFTADAAHELRTPLAILRARIDTLTNQDVARTLHGDFERMSHVVNQLLEIAELETLVADPQEKADLHDVCAEVAAFLAPLALAQRKEIVLSGTETPVWVTGNADMLQRAVRNLVENAIKHAPQGSTVEIVVGEDGTAAVLDRGPGIAEAERALIFQRFWRRDRRRAEGAGLGLSIVQRIAEAYGGEVKVDSRPGGGSAFSLRLARAD
jgi:signal transduction histidine kinase